MAATQEQIERLSTISRIDRTEARSILERHDGDLLESVLDLERQGRLAQPAGGGFYSTQPKGGSAPGRGTAYATHSGGSRPSGRSWWRVETVDGDALAKGLQDLFRRSMVNRMEVWRKGRMAASVPLLILLLLLVCFFLVTVPVLAVGLVLGFRYRFGGPDLDRELLNRSMEKASSFVSDTVDKIKAELNKHLKNNRRS